MSMIMSEYSTQAEFGTCMESISFEYSRMLTVSLSHKGEIAPFVVRYTGVTMHENGTKGHEKPHNVGILRLPNEYFSTFQNLRLGSILLAYGSWASWNLCPNQVLTATEQRIENLSIVVHHSNGLLGIYRRPRNIPELLDFQEPQVASYHV